MDPCDLDPYELLGILPSADETLIKRAYRKKALTCHPDKNPNPEAAAMFLELSKALELLLDSVKRAAYDKLYNAKKAAKIRNQELDSRRKKLKEDLEIKERLAQTLKAKYKTSEEKLAEEIERLRKEGSQALKEEMESIREKIRNEILVSTDSNDESNGGRYRLKIKWKSEKNDRNNAGYDKEKLSTIFSKYGRIAALIVSQKRNGSALIEFERGEAALKAYQLEKGYAQNPLNLSWLDQKPSDPTYFNVSKSNSNENTCPPEKDTKNNITTETSESDFEAFVFAKLKKAEEDKKKIVTE